MPAWTEHEQKQFQEAQLIHDEIFARARAAGWNPAYVSGEVKEGQEEYGPNMPAAGYVFTRGGEDGRALFVRWYPAADVSIRQVLDWIESLP